MSDSNLSKKNEILNEGKSGADMSSSGSDPSKINKEEKMKNSSDEILENAEVVEASESGSDSTKKAVDAFLNNRPEPLENVEERVDRALLNLRDAKIEVLKELTIIYENRNYYFWREEHQKYITNFSQYVKDRFGQLSSTYNADARIVKMISKLKRKDVLEKEKSGLVKLLTRITSAPDPDKNRLLDNIDDYDRDSLNAEVKELNAKNPKGYALRLVDVEDEAQIPEEGKHEMVVAKVKDSLYFRIFGDKKKNNTILDKSEKDFPAKAKEAEALKKRLEGRWNEEDIEKDTQDDIIKDVRLITKALPKNLIEIGKDMEVEVDEESGKISISFKSGKQSSDTLTFLKQYLEELKGKTIRKPKEN